MKEHPMKRVAVFGNTGGGKSTLAKRLAGLTRLPLYPLDLIQYRAGGDPVPDEEYLKAHAELPKCPRPRNAPMRWRRCRSRQ